MRLAAALMLRSPHSGPQTQVKTIRIVVVTTKQGHSKRPIRARGPVQYSDLGPDFSCVLKDAFDGGLNDQV